MPFPSRLPPPAAAAAATAAAVLAAVALRRYLSTRPRSATSAHRSSTAPAAAGVGATTRLLLSGKSPQDQQLLASAARELSLEELGGGELAVSLAPGGGGVEGFDAAAYMGALLARRFGRWLLWSPRMASTHDLVTQ
jgi:biotin--protein ligase